MPSNNEKRRKHPPPGSDNARAEGCRCAVMDNRRGRGIYNDKNGEPMFVISEACPMHGGGDALSETEAKETR